MAGVDMIRDQQLYAGMQGGQVPRSPKRAGKRPKPGCRFISQIVAENVRGYRVLRRLKQADLADRMRLLGFDWAQGTVSDLERNARELSAPELFAIALALEVTPSDLQDPAGADGRARFDIDLEHGGRIDGWAAQALLRDVALPNWELDQGGQIKSLRIDPKDGTDADTLVRLQYIWSRGRKGQ